MDLCLPQNIRRFRKERHLTQEQLAEAMGVTLGAVYKWESGQSTPELRLIAALAEFFNVSTDALIGYRIHPCNMESLLEDLNLCRENRDYETAEQVIREALQKYPNHFEINYCCAQLLIQIAEDRNYAADYETALLQLGRACMLINQNTDSSVSEFSIRNQMACLHFRLGHTDICLEILKKYNFCGINDAQIGCILADCYHRTDEASVYLKRAFSRILTDLDHVVTGFTTVLFQKKEYDTLISGVEWLRTVFRGGESMDIVTWFQKYECVLLAMEAEIFCITDNKSQARKKLKEAAVLAQRIDEANDSDIHMPRLMKAFGAEDNHYLSYGKTALEATERRVMTDAEVVPELPLIWGEMQKEVFSK